MQIPVLIEPVAGNGYRARGGEPLPLTAEGASPEEALAKLREQIQQRLAGGAQVVPLELASEPHPLAPFAGMFKNDPLFDQWQQAIEDYRRQVDEATDVL